jgi:PAS domain S-box-containing protein
MLIQLMALSDDIFASGTALGPAPILDYISASMERVMGWPPSAMLGHNPFEYVHPDDQQRVGALLATVVDGSVPCVHIMFRFLHAAGGYRWLHAQYCRQDDLLVCLARDATAYKSMEEALREYILSTSHDLRTPCHGIMTAAQLLAAREGVARDAEAAFLVQAVRSSCALSLGMITNILETRLQNPSTQSGGGSAAAAQEGARGVQRLLLKPARFSLRALVLDVLQTCRVGCGLLRGRLEWVNESDALPGAAFADAERIAQVLQSVIVYTLHHSAGDTPLTLHVRVVPPAADAPPADAELQLVVCDPGRNLLADDAQRIFSANFISPDGGVEARISAATLGLFVARSVARAMGGDVSADSSAPSCGDAHGSELRVRLPIALDAPTAAEGAGASAQPAAAQQQQQQESGSPPAAAKRPPPSMPAPSPLLAGAEVAAPPQKVGRAAAASENAASVPSAADDEQAGPRPRCLLVDDHELNLKLVKRLLERHGFDVTTATNGLEALQQLQASLSGAPGAASPPDVALVDLLMPIMGGLEMTRRFREWCVALHAFMLLLLQFSLPDVCVCATQGACDAAGGASPVHVCAVCQRAGLPRGGVHGGGHGCAPGQAAARGLYRAAAAAHHGRGGAAGRRSSSRVLTHAAVVARARDAYAPGKHRSSRRHTHNTTAHASARQRTALTRRHQPSSPAQPTRRALTARRARHPPPHHHPPPALPPPPRAPPYPPSWAAHTRAPHAS